MAEFGLGLYQRDACVDGAPWRNLMQVITQTTQPKKTSSYSTDFSRNVSISEELEVASFNEVGHTPLKNIDSDYNITPNKGFDFLLDLPTEEEINYGANITSDDIDLLLNDNSLICVARDTI